VDNLNNLRRETSGYFGNKNGEFLKDKINGLTKNSKGKNIRDLCMGINELKSDDQNILNRWKNYFSY
jgi:hypothetical protein